MQPCKKQKTDLLSHEWFGGFLRRLLLKRFRSVVFQMNDAPFKKGDVVLTDFYPKEVNESRTVTKWLPLPRFPVWLAG